MREKADEIEKVIQTHGFSINSMISDVMKRFKFRSLCHKAGLPYDSAISAVFLYTFSF